MARKPRPIGLPVELILHHPQFAFLGGASVRAISAICLAYWQAECPAIDLEKGWAIDPRIIAASRVQPAHWSQFCSHDTNTLRDILADLQAYHRAESHRLEVLQRARSGAGRKGAVARARIATLKKLHGNAGLDHLATAQTAPRHENPRAAMKPAELAALPKPQPKPTEGRMRD